MTQRNVLLIIGALVLMAITSVATIFIYTTVVGGSGEASEPLSAPTLSLATSTPNPQAAQIAQLSTQVAALQAENAVLKAGQGNAAGAPATDPTPEATASTESTAAATANADVTAATDAAAAPAGSTDRAVYRISVDESTVSFKITEELFGQPKEVVGTTNQVAGDILIDTSTPANSEIGVIRINVRTLKTDNENRNRAIRARILQSADDQYQFSQFTPTAVTGLPSSVAIGQEITFQITGNLQVRDVTKPVTFDVTARLASADRLEGKAVAKVTRGQFNLEIPNAPGVANVSDDVTLEIDFVANRVQS
jgi:polyisoprenoid-binding protein YceI